MFGWIPFIGPFLQAGVNLFKVVSDASVQKAQIAANATATEGAQGVDVIAIRASVAKTFAHDVGVMFARDLILNWYAIYISLIFYDSCFRNILPAGSTWPILAIPASLDYLCNGIIAFLFITQWMGRK